MKKLFIVVTLLVFATPFVASAQSSANWSTNVTYGTPVQSPSINTGPNTYQLSTGDGNLPPYQALEPLSSGFSNGTYTNLADYLNAIYLTSITVGSLIAVVMLVTSGIRLMLSEAFTDRDKAKKQITSAVWGLVLLVGSVVFLYTINPNLLRFTFLPSQSAYGTSKNSAPPSQTSLSSNLTQTELDECARLGKRLVIQPAGNTLCQ